MLIAVLMLMVTVSPAQIVTTSHYVTLTWDANPEPDIRHYRIYTATASQGYTITLAVVSPSSAPMKTVGPFADGIHYFVLTAVNELGEESNRSNEVWASIGLPPPVPGPAAPVNLRMVN